MAMALNGKNKHYLWQQIMPRHWFAESKKVNFPEAEMQSIIDTTPEQLEAVISQLQSSLPHGFPEDISSPIFEGMLKAGRKFGIT